MSECLPVKHAKQTSFTSYLGCAERMVAMRPAVALHHPATRLCLIGFVGEDILDHNLELAIVWLHIPIASKNPLRPALRGAKSTRLLRERKSTWVNGDIGSPYLQSRRRLVKGFPDLRQGEGFGRGAAREHLCELVKSVHGLGRGRTSRSSLGLG